MHEVGALVAPLADRWSLRLTIGVVITLLGAASLLTGLLAGGDNALALVGLGAAVIFVGIAVLGPVIARPVSRIIGAPLPRLKGMSGTLARENAMRNPRRTASTASALMIGVALVACITIFASSAKGSLEVLIDESFGGDFIVAAEAIGMGGLGPELAGEVAELTEVDTATPIRFGVATKAGGGNASLVGAPAAELVEVVNVEVLEGDPSRLDATSVAVDDELAAAEGLALGDPVTLKFGATGEQELTVGMIYAPGELLQGYLLDIPAFEANFPDALDSLVYVMLAEGADPAAAKASIATVTDGYPNAELQDLTEFKESQTGQIDQLLNLIYVLLALAVVIALIGIANTLALSIFERTRELGLLRAVGMTRRQLRSTVRWESVIIASD